MNSMLLGFAGYSLLLSSCVTLIYLLRMGCVKDILESPLQILSTSDTVISMITSIILLLNQSWPLRNSGRDSMDETEGRLLGNRRNQTCMGFYLNQSDSPSDIQDVGRMDGECTFQHVLMQYAMFLVPFANAFVSLLIYSVQCSSGISCVAKKCSKLTIAARNTGANPDSKDESTEKTIHTVSNEKIKRSNLNNDSKLTGFGLITQWLVPVLVTAALSLSKPQDMEKLHETDAMECIFRVNFPLESCDISDDGTMINRTDHYYDGLPDKIQVYDLDTPRISYPDSVVIDEIISKVRRVVNSAINKTCDDSTELKNSSSFKPWNITHYLTSDDSMRRNLSNIDDEMLEKLTKIQQVLDTEDLGGLDNCTTAEPEDSTETEPEVNEDEELKLFEEAVENADAQVTANSTRTIPETIQPDAFPQEIPPARTNGDGDNWDDKNLHSNRTTITKEKLNAKIYEDIIKRIRDTVTRVREKGLAENLSNFEDSKLQIIPSGSMGVGEDRKHRGKIIDKSETRIKMYTGCFLSAKFLKIHLSIFLFIVYFVPVLISVILQTRAVYVCKNVYQQIGTMDNKDVKKAEENAASNSNSKSGWFTGDPQEPISAVTESSRGSDNIEVASMSRNPEFGRREDRRSGVKQVLEETKGIQMLFNVLTKSLMLGILMWTPAFLQILSKVFLCASTPSWLANFLYFIGVSFGVVKNLINVNIARINKQMVDECYGKENSVHPSA